MTAPARQDEDDAKVHQVGWKAEAWTRILKAAEALAEREHLRVTPTDIIRKGTLQYVDEILDERQAAKAS